MASPRTRSASVSPGVDIADPKAELNEIISLLKSDFKLALRASEIGAKNNSMIRNESTGETFQVRDIKNHFKSLVDRRLRGLKKYLRLPRKQRRAMGAGERKPKGAVNGIVYLLDPLYNFFTKNKERFGYLDPRDKSKGLLIDALTTLVKERIALRITVLTLFNVYVARNNLKAKTDKRKISADDYMRRYLDSKEFPAAFVPGKSKEKLEKQYVLNEGISVFKAVKKISPEFNPDSFDLKYFQLFITSSIYSYNDLEGQEDPQAEELAKKLRMYEENPEKLFKEREDLKRSHDAFKEMQSS